MISDYLVKCFSELNSSLVNYCILRDYENLPLKFNNDIDILVDESNFEEAIDIFVNEASGKITLIKTKFRFGYAGLYFYHAETNQIFLIDIFFRLQKKWRKYADSSDILKTKIYYKDFYVIENNYEIYTICLKEMLTYGFVRKKYLNRISNLKIDKKIFMKIAEKHLSHADSLNLFESVINKSVLKALLPLI